MAPRIFTLLRSPVTGISGGWPTRLQVACRVESCRKLASSVKISAVPSRWDFFLDWDKCDDASGLAPRRRREPTLGEVVGRRSPPHVGVCAHGRDDTGYR